MPAPLLATSRWPGSGCLNTRRRIRLTVAWLNPALCAMARVDQRLLPSGGEMSAYPNTVAISSLDVVGRPVRGASCNPASPYSAKRRHHFAAVAGLTELRRAASVTPPEAQSRTIWARVTTPCAALREVAVRVRASRSAGVSARTPSTICFPACYPTPSFDSV